MELTETTKEHASSSGDKPKRKKVKIRKKKLKHRILDHNWVGFATYMVTNVPAVIIAAALYMYEFNQHQTELMSFSMFMVSNVLWQYIFIVPFWSYFKKNKINKAAKSLIISSLGLTPIIVFAVISLSAYLFFT